MRLHFISLSSYDWTGRPCPRRHLASLDRCLFVQQVSTIYEELSLAKDEPDLASDNNRLIA